MRLVLALVWMSGCGPTPAPVVARVEPLGCLRSADEAALECPLEHCPARQPCDDPFGGQPKKSCELEAGRAAYELGEYEGALGCFLASYEISRGWQMLFNIGSVRERLGQRERALACFEVALEQADETAAERLRERIARLRQ